MKYLLSKLEGLDADPDGMDKGRKGPWAHGFSMSMKTHMINSKPPTATNSKRSYRLSGVAHEFAVTYGALADSAPHKASAVIRSSLKEVATYIVFRIFDSVKAHKTAKTRHLASALERKGFHVLRGNQQRANTTLAGIMKVESGKRPIWQFYDVHTDTSALGHRFPRNFHVTLDDDDGGNFNLD